MIGIILASHTGIPFRKGLFVDLQSKASTRLDL